jgi:ELWxxDGT repeat protein
VYKNKLYFFATNASNVKQLWESDGTDAGTKALVSIGTASALVIYNDTLYFSGRINNTDTLGVELYKINLQDDTLAASEMQNNNISVYPNPSKGEVFISNLKSGKFELYDTTGKLIKGGNFSDSKILLSAQQGVYVLKLKSENSKTNFVTRVIIK